MKKTTMARRSMLAAIALSLTAGASAAPYQVTDLGSLSELGSFGFDINESGTVVGVSNLNQLPRAIQYDTQLVNLGDLDLGTSAAFAINDASTAVGYAEGDIDDQTLERGVIYEGGQVIAIPTAEDVFDTQALDINSSNMIIGFVELDVDPDDMLVAVPRGFIYDRVADTYLAFIEPLEDGDATRQTTLVSINDSNEFVGWSQLFNADSQLVVEAVTGTIADPQNLTVIGDLGGLATFPTKINDSGVVVGRSQKNDGIFTAFVLDPAAGTDLVDLGFIDDRFPGSTAWDVNESGVIVGASLVAPSSEPRNVAVIAENGSWVDLNTMIDCTDGWTLTEARAINDAGQITGFGVFEGEVRAFRLEPTPNDGPADQSCAPVTPPIEEPSSGGGGGSLSLFALTGLVLLRRMRHTKR